MTGSEVPLGLADRSLAVKIYEVVRERIIAGTLAPGERIRERELAEELGVSRIPVREAMPRLESEGFVISVPRRGVIVTDLTLRDVEELFRVRSSLEVLAAKLAAEQCAAGADPAPLKARLAAAEQAIDSGDDRAIADANSALHEEILSLASNNLLLSIMGPINGRVRRLFRLEKDRDQLVLCSEHREMCRAIIDGNVEMAGALAFAHVEHSRVESLDLMRQQLADSDRDV